MECRQRQHRGCHQLDLPPHAPAGKEEAHPRLGTIPDMLVQACLGTPPPRWASESPSNLRSPVTGRDKLAAGHTGCGREQGGLPLATHLATKVNPELMSEE